MEDIFEGAEFGTLFRTRDNRKAILVTHSRRGYVCSVQSALGGLNSVQIPYNPDGSRERYTKEDDADIVGRWTDSVNEGKLTRMANAYMLHPDRTIESYALLTEMMEAFKAGYRKAKEE